MMIATSILMYTQNYIFNKGKCQLYADQYFLSEAATKIYLIKYAIFLREYRSDGSGWQEGAEVGVGRILCQAWTFWAPLNV